MCFVSREEVGNLAEGNVLTFKEAKGGFFMLLFIWSCPCHRSNETLQHYLQCFSLASSRRLLLTHPLSVPRRQRDEWISVAEPWSEGDSLRTKLVLTFLHFPLSFHPLFFLFLRLRQWQLSVSLCFISRIHSKRVLVICWLMQMTVCLVWQELLREVPPSSLKVLPFIHGCPWWNALDMRCATDP